MHTRLRVGPTKFCHSVKLRVVRTPVSLPHPIRPMQLLLFAQALEILSYNQYRTPDRETRVRSSAGSVCCFLEQETFTPQKVLVIPRNRWLRLNMTEKLFTGTLNHNQNKTKQISYEPRREKTRFLHMRKERRRSASR